MWGDGSKEFAKRQASTAAGSSEAPIIEVVPEPEPVEAVALVAGEAQVAAEEQRADDVEAERTGAVECDLPEAAASEEGAVNCVDASKSDTSLVHTGRGARARKPYSRHGQV
jgi:hypothetical protein